MRQGSVLRRNNVNVQGSGGDVLVFGHGLGCDQRVWRRVQPEFEKSHRSVLFDYVGSGGSDFSAYDSKRYCNLAGYAKDVIEVCEELEVKNATFVGHSVSSMIGILAGIQAPEMIDRIVLLAPSPRYINDPPYIGGFDATDVVRLFELMDQNFTGWAKSFADIAGRDPDVARELAANFCASDFQIAREFAQTTFYCDCRDDLRRVEQPCLVIQCSDDDIAPVSVGEYTAEHLPKSTFRLLEASGHLPHLTHASLTSALIGEFLRSEE
jgi:sigma-B regulation protein RsbQ